MSTEVSVERNGSHRVAEATIFSIILSLSFSHFLNDTMQSLVPALYPMLKDSFSLSFAQIGLITLVMQVTSSLLQPIVGLVADWRPQPYSLAAGMGSTFIGLLMLANASNFHLLLVAAALVGVGSAVFHPEASRVARMASGGRHGLAQSLFQVGGNVGSALGPILAAFIVIPRGQGSVGWFSGAALVAMTVLFGVGNWYRKEHAVPPMRGRARQGAMRTDLSRRKIVWSLVILLSLIFSKAFYQASISSYYIFYLISKFHVSVASAQIHLFAFLASIAVGTLIGGPLGDKIGRKYVIWGSIVGVIPFTMVLPYVGLFWTGILIVAIGLILASATSAIVVYALDLVPGKIGMISGLFFGLSFGLAGVGAAVLGKLADTAGIDAVYHVCAFLPLIGLLTAFLPNIGTPTAPGAAKPAATPAE
ncbi:MAG TPA: MFS transporter [Stellaceae bacterium]|jgi:FSR family fosmidomycin resistance protein-like MFS transporter|nr:MFS transporter [Stellaceae bacterium]